MKLTPATKRAPATTPDWKPAQRVKWLERLIRKQGIDKVLRFRDMVETGLSNAEIGRRMDHPRATIQLWRNRLEYQSSRYVVHKEVLEILKEDGKGGLRA